DLVERDKYLLPAGRMVPSALQYVDPPGAPHRATLQRQNPSDGFSTGRQAPRRRHDDLAPKKRHDDRVRQRAPGDPPALGSRIEKGGDALGHAAGQLRMKTAKRLSMDAMDF